VSVLILPVCSFVFRVTHKMSAKLQVVIYSVDIMSEKCYIYMGHNFNYCVVVQLHLP